MTSWINPDEQLAHKTFDDYMLSVVEAMDAIEQATGERRSMPPATAWRYHPAHHMAYLAAKKDKRVKSAICFACMTISASRATEVFIDEELITLLEKQMGERAIWTAARWPGCSACARQRFDLVLRGQQYLLGKDPTPSTCCTGIRFHPDAPDMHSFYVRNMYQKNLLREPGGLTLAGVPIDLRKIKTPVCFLAAYEDHIAPWKSTYAGTQLVGGR